MTSVTLLWWQAVHTSCWRNMSWAVRSRALARVHSALVILYVIQFLFTLAFQNKFDIPLLSITFVLFSAQRCPAVNLRRIAYLLYTPVPYRLTKLHCKNSYC